VDTTLTDSQAGRSLNAAYEALVREETAQGKTDLLRAFRGAILHGLADMVHVEHEGRRPDSIIADILTEI
jgi:hypothetical protein